MSDLPVLKCKRINGCRWHDTEFDYNCEKYSHDTTLLVSCNGYLRKKESKGVFQMTKSDAQIIVEEDGNEIYILNPSALLRKAVEWLEGEKDGKKKKGLT